MAEYLSTVDTYSTPVWLQVLRPEQAAVLLATAYPSNIDALAFINALASSMPCV
jgi:hypothetical protein